MPKLLFSLVLLLSLSAASSAKTLLVLGDSLSAGYGIGPTEGWVSLLQQSFSDSARKDAPHKIVNASVSGETSGGALARLPALLSAHSPDIVIVELGGNDGLRGHAIKILRQNLSQIVHLSREAGAKPLLLGMQIPPNYGQRYTKQFTQVYSDLAEAESLPLVPFFLDKVALRTEWMQADGIHPRAEAQPQLLNNVLPHLTPLLAP